MDLPDQLTVARAAAVPVVVLLYAWPFEGHAYWATTAFVVAMATDWFDGRIARSRGRTSSLGSLLDPMADKVLVLAVLVMLVDADVVPGWMVAAIVARELLVSGLRLAALERGVVLEARDLGKLKTWSQAIAGAPVIDAAPTSQPPVWPSVGALLVSGWTGGMVATVFWAPLLGAAR